jgi:hypothetical protein
MDSGEESPCLSFSCEKEIAIQNLSIVVGVRCVRFNEGEMAVSEINLPGENSAFLYLIRSDIGSSEQQICDIINNPYNKSLIDQADWGNPVNVDIPASIPFFVGPQSATFLHLYVGKQTSNYTFVGPLSANHDLNCCRTPPPVPTFNHWGLLLFAILLLALAYSAVRRKRAS